MAERVLIVDDEENLVTLFSKILRKEGYEVETAGNGWGALEILKQGGIDLVVSDLMMPGMDGLALLAKAKEIDPALQFIVLTGVGTVETAVQAMKGGAFDYIEKPVQREEILVAVRRALDHGKLRREVERLRDEVTEQHQFGNLLGKSKRMRDLFKLLRRVAASPATILIQGESGTGKELIARAIHYNSLRRAEPFVAVDCGAIPETLIESELFGHARGAFTGAIRTKKGLFEEADRGTLFLDEIGNVSPGMQAKLLRALQEGEIRPVGSNEVIKVDVRVISATNRDLRQAVQTREFREDLYYRLAVVPVFIPPLRERREDIPLLAAHFVERFAARQGVKKRLTTDALSALLSYDWPGNVRELENTLERAVILSEGLDIRAQHLILDTRDAGRTAPVISLRERTADATAETEREAILAALKEAQGNKSKAARALRVSRGTLYNKIREYHIE
jgi:two-component system response regulator HydG